MGRAVKILLVEDSQDDALLFRMGVRGQASVIHVSDAEAAIVHLETNPLPDLIVMDLTLPGMSVNRFLHWFRTNPGVQKIPIVVLTGAVQVPEDVRSAVRKTFFKSANLVETRRTVSEIIGLGEPKSGL